MLPGFPKAARKAHVLPGLAVHSLVSIAQFCDNGCTAYFDQKCCCILFNNKVILSCPRDPRIKLWRLPLQQSTDHKHPYMAHETTSTPHPPSQHSTNEGVAHPPSQHIPTEGVVMSQLCNNVYQCTTICKLLCFLHAAAFSLPPSTWIQTIKNNQFATWPNVTTKNVRKYLPDLVATAKGHLDRLRKNLRSTKGDNFTTDLFPPKKGNRTNFIFAAFVSTDPNNNTVYIDLTGKFPVTSASGMKYILVTYHYDSNAILVCPMENKSDSEAIHVYAEVYEYLTARGFPPTLYVMDNEASTVLKQEINKRRAKYQLVEPHNHRVNAAERVICTFKNHFIAGLCSTDPAFLIAL